VTTIDNDAIVTGSYDATTDFDPPGAGGAVKVNGTANAFVARYSPAGALRWVKTFRPGNNQTGLSLSPLPGGHILVCGRFETTLTSTGNTDVFIARLDGDGKVLSASQIGGPGEEVDVLTTTAGPTAVIVGDTGSNPVTFPDGTHRKRLGIFDGYILQQP
jgi:hypothetical protein